MSRNEFTSVLNNVNQSLLDFFSGFSIFFESLSPKYCMLSEERLWRFDERMYFLCYKMTAVRVKVLKPIYSLILSKFR